MKETHNVTITWKNDQGAAIEGLTLEQIHQLSAILEASGVWYQWQGMTQGMTHAGTDWRARLNGLWLRVNAWMQGE
jgi:hypothetical protein